MLNNVRALPLLLLDPLFATCLVIAAVSGISLYRKRKSPILTRGTKTALALLLALTAGAVLFTVVMALIFGPPPD